jgi:hypothetical protein
MSSPFFARKGAGGIEKTQTFLIEIERNEKTSPSGLAKRNGLGLGFSLSVRATWQPYAGTAIAVDWRLGI